MCAAPVSGIDGTLLTHYFFLSIAALICIKVLVNSSGSYLLRAEECFESVIFYIFNILDSCVVLYTKNNYVDVSAGVNRKREGTPYLSAPPALTVSAQPRDQSSVQSEILIASS